jgi:hypothetical protein
VSVAGNRCSTNVEFAISGLFHEMTMVNLYVKLLTRRAIVLIGTKHEIREGLATTSGIVVDVINGK